MLLNLFRNEVEFKNIQGYDDLKDIVRRVLDADDNYNLLFVGPPASAAPRGNSRALLVIPRLKG